MGIRFTCSVLLDTSCFTSMKFFILFAVLTTVLAVPQDHEWTKFKAQFGKKYATAEEEAQRHSIFVQNMEKVERHNERAKNGQVSYTLGMNKFADLTFEEFSKTHLGFKNKGKVPAPRTHVKGDVSTLPASVDWRKKGIVTEVKDQGGCGSCWAFSAVASMESAHAQATGKLVELSEQNLVDCSRAEGDQGCSGGLMDYAFNYTIINGGIDTETSYPYIGEDGSCKFNVANVGLTLRNYTDIVSGDESALADAVSQRVVSVGIEVNGDFQLYKSGILSAACPDPAEIDHGVAAVGYGTEDGVDFWIIKNSWGKDWGEQGYVRFIKGQDFCGVADWASYPDV
ncbi:cathepsin L-like peptidase [Brevipalpus obovatus]|uniref:cathepsin L-like peptidase n=1 Tax=Brevipalpus obovatus TaxID=246614 RepID=UPI003D9F2A61